MAHPVKRFSERGENMVQEQELGRLYKIIRFSRHGRDRAVRGLGHLSRQEAQAHCNRSDAHAAERYCSICKMSHRAWFDGYTER